MSARSAISSLDKNEAPLRIASAFRKLPPPVIIVGMHRSGTSLVAGMLALMGVYIDPAFHVSAAQDQGDGPGSQQRTDGYAEATAFRLLNERIMERAGATWENVQPFLKRRDRPLFARTSLALMQMATYFSLKHDYLQRRPQPAEGPWGWKDPRSSLTLPYWLRLFPQSRILHVRRQPEAIVASLMRRSTITLAADSTPPPWHARLLRLARHPQLALSALGRRTGLAPPAAFTPQSLLDYNYCLELTHSYIQECLRYQGCAQPYLEVWFEDILADPAATVAALTNFVQIAPDRTTREQAISFVQRGRK